MIPPCDTSNLLKNFGYKEGGNLFFFSWLSAAYMGYSWHAGSQIRRCWRWQLLCCGRLHSSGIALFLLW